MQGDASARQDISDSAGSASVDPFPDRWFSAEELADRVREFVPVHGWDKVHAVLERHWHRYVYSHPQELLQAYQALPGEAFVKRPAILHGVHYLQRMVQETDPIRWTHCEQAELASPVEEDRLNTLINLTSRTAEHRVEGRLPEAVQVVDRVQAALASASAPDRDRVRMSLPHLRLVWGRVFLASEDPRAVSELERCYEEGRLSGQSQVSRRAAASLGWLHASRGESRLAKAWLRRAENEPDAVDRYDATVNVTHALLLADSGDREGADVHLGRVRSLGAGESWARVLWVESICVTGADDTAVLAGRIDEELGRHPGALEHDGDDRSCLLRAMVGAASARGRLGSLELGTSKSGAVDQLLSAAVAHARGDNQLALRHLLQASPTEMSRRRRVVTLVLSAGVQLALGRERAAGEHYRDARALIEAEGLRSSYGALTAAEHRRLLELTGLEPPASMPPFRRQPSGLDRLSRREREILGALVTDDRLSEIAASHFISLNTLKTTLKGIYRKLDVQNRRQAAEVAVHAGLGPGG
ncbi:MULTISPECIES: LuxR family transcriptional regulator [Arthrobacter]|uniref:LuxR C-terminal-related transcriptional regulator n=2 Tax=Arthrobacter TaxID=1663 RepID=A0ABU9KMV1_9MICC|nr:LuxR family transcriptional regulator [Arthrobacter sp. YJM1]MDP5227507.1 LuxR C-terminal-related transcriptional regulator [Arthrobacter sp. YJM1]